MADKPTDTQRVIDALRLVDKGFRTNRLKDVSIIVGNDVKALSAIVADALKSEGTANGR